MALLYRIESYLKRSGSSATRFGREAAGDPRLVFDMRRGRAPRDEIRGRIEGFLDSKRGRGGKTCSR
ncbi:MAG TPA: hypothetical protein VF727_06285 [Allosphingosinicella sp.]